MRIALFVHCFFPDHIYGTEAYTMALAQELQALGCSVLVVSAVFAGEPSAGALVHEYEIDGIQVWAVDKNQAPHKDLKGTYYQPENRWIYERILRRWAPDVVHVNHLINHTGALLDVLERMAIPTFGTLTDFFGFCFNNKLEAADGSLCTGPNARRSNCVACLFKAAHVGADARPLVRAASTPFRRNTASNLLARYPSLAGSLKPTVTQLIERPDLLMKRYNSAYSGLIAPSAFLRDAYISNGLTVPLKLSHFGIEVDRSSKPPSPKPDVTRIGYVGQIAPHKGVHILMDAFLQVNSPALSLDIWGPASQDPAYFKDLVDRSEGRPVRFNGTFPTKDIASVLAQVDVLVIPSTWYENSPLIMLQALATHTPVLVSDVLGLTEFIEDGVSGFRFGRGNANELAVRLQAFADDVQLARRMSAHTRYDRTPRDMALEALGLYQATCNVSVPVKAVGRNRKGRVNG